MCRAPKCTGSSHSIPTSDRACGPPCPQAVPRRSLSGRRRRRACRTCRGAAWGCVGETTADGRVTLEPDLLPRPLRGCAVGHDRRPLGRPARWPRLDALLAEAHRDACASTYRAMPARSRSAPTRSRRPSRRRPPPQRRGRDRPQRLARPVLARADGRGRDPAGRVAYGPVAAATMPILFDAMLLTARRMRCASARPRKFPG